MLVGGVMVMSIAFFAKGFGKIGWCILTNMSPNEILGAVSCLFINVCKSTRRPTENGATVSGYKRSGAKRTIQNV